MTSATIRNERCAVVLVEQPDEAALLIQLALDVTSMLGVEAIAYGDKGSAVVSCDELTDADRSKTEGCVLIANTRGLLVLLSECHDQQVAELQNYRPDHALSLTVRNVRLILEDAIAGLAS